MELCYRNNPKSLFRKYANSEAGRYLLGIKDGFPIVKVTPNSYHQLVDIQNDIPLIRAMFYTDNFIQKQLEIPLTKMAIAEEYKHIEKPYEAFVHYAGLELHQYPRIYLATFTANGGGNGKIRAQGNVYATVQAATTGTASAVGQATNYYADPTYIIDRGFAPFDTSSIGAGTTIVSSFLRAVGNGTGENANTDSLSVVASTQASNTA